MLETFVLDLLRAQRPSSSGRTTEATRLSPPHAECALDGGALWNESERPHGHLWYAAAPAEPGEYRPFGCSVGGFRLLRCTYGVRMGWKAHEVRMHTGV